MSRKLGSCFVGSVGCLLVVLLGGSFMAIIGGHFHINFGGIVFVLFVGGAVGLLLDVVYSKGVADGESSGDAQHLEGQAQDSTTGTDNETGRVSRDYVQPWGSVQPATVDEALAKITEAFWRRDRPDFSRSADGLKVLFRTPMSDGDRTLALVADEASDSVTIHIADDLGEVVAPTGPWRNQSDANVDLSNAYRFVEAYFGERYAHVLTPDGEHELVSADELAQTIEASQGARVRSWLGTLDEA